MCSLGNIGFKSYGAKELDGDDMDCFSQWIDSFNGITLSTLREE